MQHDRDPTADDRLIEEAKQRARQFRREAVGVFWRSVGDAARGAVRAARRIAANGHHHIHHGV